jgi:hypothetical protein
MAAIGFRAEKDAVNWAVVERDGEIYRVIEDGRFAAPKSYEESVGLAWYRERIQSLVHQHGATKAAIRYAETYLPRIRKSVLESLFKRARLEGVLIEALASKGVPVGTGAMQQIASRLGSKSAKHYVAGGEFRGLDLSDKSDNLKEAIIVAASMLEES